MKSILHKHVPSFSFSSFNFSPSADSPSPSLPRSQPSSPPADSSSEPPPLPEPPHSAIGFSFPSQQIQHSSRKRISRINLPRSSHRASEPIYVGFSSADPLQLVRLNRPLSSLSDAAHSVSAPPTPSVGSTQNGQHSRRGSLVESIADSLALLPLTPERLRPPDRPRKRWSNFFTTSSHLLGRSRSPSPSPYLSKFRSPVASSRDRLPDSEPSSSCDDLASGHTHSDEDDVVSVVSSDRDTRGDQTVTEDDDEGDEGHDEDGDEENSQADEEINSDEEADQTILANTNANASSMTPIDYLQNSDQPVPFADHAPNLTSPPPEWGSFMSSGAGKPVQRKPSVARSVSSLKRRKSGPGSQANLSLRVSRPIYEKNRCTITIEHGDHAEAVRKAERTRFYLVACDLSQESKYAIEWTIGTVLRQGDECLMIMVLETETKFDPEEGASQAIRTAKIRNQKVRQEKATLLVREATLLLERTRLSVKVTCQAVHAKNAKHLLVDCIDFLEPNLVVVGGHGFNKPSTHPKVRTPAGSLSTSAITTPSVPSSAPGSLMGSVSNYLVHKSSVPVMVARKKLRAPIKVYKKKVQLTRNPRKKLEEAAIEKSSVKSTESSPNSVRVRKLSVVGEDDGVLAGSGQGQHPSLNDQNSTE